MKIKLKTRIDFNCKLHFANDILIITVKSHNNRKFLDFYLC